MNNRPVASLTPTLLARKGAARPAMRPQLTPLRAFSDNGTRPIDDLGWNDMGADADAASQPPVAEPMAVEQPAAIAPEAPAAEVVVLNPAIEPAPAHVPEVVQQQAEIAERVAKPRRSALTAGRRAAFTLRLDSERHLQLRLACVTRNRSAQQLVTEALDRLIADMPEVAELAAKVRKNR